MAGFGSAVLLYVFFLLCSIRFEERRGECMLIAGSVVGSWRGTGLAPVCSVKRVVSLQRKKKMEKTCQKPGERREGITFTVMNENMSLPEQRSQPLWHQGRVLL